MIMDLKKNSSPTNAEKWKLIQTLTEEFNKSQQRQKGKQEESRRQFSTTRQSIYKQLEAMHSDNTSKTSGCKHAPSQPKKKTNKKQKMRAQNTTPQKLSTYGFHVASPSADHVRRVKVEDVMPDQIHFMDKISIYEKRPYDIHTSSSIYDIKHMFTAHKQQYPTSWKENLRDLLRKLLCIDPDERICNLETLKNHSFISSVDLTRVLKQEVKPTFVPSNDHLNCDPTYELEEMIIESKPLHKKKKRLAKQNSKRERNSQSSVDIPDDPMQACLEAISKDFKLYNRERKLAKEDIKGNGKEDVT